MAKRFFETAIWEEDWYLVMPVEYKLFFHWVISKCDHAGFFKPNIEAFNRFNSVSANLKKSLELFNNGKQRIRVLAGGQWFVEDFIAFQYGAALNPANRVHASILRLLGQNALNLTSIRGLLDPKDRVKDKDKDKDSEKGGMGENNIPAEFIEFHRLYPTNTGAVHSFGKKTALTEFKLFKAAHKDWKAILPMLVPAIKNQIEHWTHNNRNPEPFKMKHISKWLSEKCWEEEIQAHPSKKSTEKVPFF